MPADTLLAVIPFYKNQRQLDTCLAHLQAQTHPVTPWIHDNSTDNLGFTKAINLGLREAIRARVLAGAQARDGGTREQLLRGARQVIRGAGTESDDADDGAHLYVAAAPVRVVAPLTLTGAGVAGANTCGPVVFRPQRPKAGSTCTAAS